MNRKTSKRPTSQWWYDYRILNFKQEAAVVTSKEQSGKPLISLTEGKDLGEIKGLFLDRDMRQVAAVFTGTEGIINRKTLAVAREDVTLMGQDAWLVSSSDVVKPVDEITDSVSFTLVNDLRGREIQTEGGTKLCTVDDVILDGEGRVLGFSLGKVFAQGPLADKKAIVREAIHDLGGPEKPMIADLHAAESKSISSL
jgi:uncharacterized protein YrrD